MNDTRAPCPCVWRNNCFQHFGASARQTQCGRLPTLTGHAIRAQARDMARAINWPKWLDSSVSRSCGADILNAPGPLRYQFADFSRPIVVIAPHSARCCRPGLLHLLLFWRHGASAITLLAATTGERLALVHAVGSGVETSTGPGTGGSKKIAGNRN